VYVPTLKLSTAHTATYVDGPYDVVQQRASSFLRRGVGSRAR
jgi:hypothetical protein